MQETHSEKGNKPKGKKVETTAVVQGVMVETLAYDDGMLIESRFGFVSELTRETTSNHQYRFQHCL